MSARKRLMIILLPIFCMFSLAKSNRLQDIFTSIYRKKLWGGGKETYSGIGSTHFFTQAIRRELPTLFKKLGIRTLLDAPCGDLNWIKEVPLDLDMYMGVDIVQELISQNIKKYQTKSRKFFYRDITQDPLPTADLILCRDCLIHLKFKGIFKTIENFKRSKSTYLLTTTYTSRSNNDALTDQNIRSGKFNPINLQAPPFNFPTPLYCISEEYPDDKDRCLALWRLEDL